MTEVDEEQDEPRWYINIDWYQQNNRSFVALIRDRLCATCSEKLAGKEATQAKIMQAIKSCCVKTPGFISPHLPILECIFRLFLANGNKPLKPTELGEKLGKYREGDSRITSSRVLSRLLSGDNHYGFGQVED